jgi:hypothetical protein
VKLRSGQAVSSKNEKDDSYFVKLNNKQIYKSGMDLCNCYFQGVEVGPYAIGDNDVIGVGTSSAAAGGGVGYTFLIVNKNGQVTKPKVYDITGKLLKDADGSILCNVDGFDETKLVGDKVITSCTEKDGRRTKVIKYTLENDSIRVTR